MSAIFHEIEKCMTELGTENGKMTASFIFPGSFGGFQGHFEGNPVLPGICKIQAVLAMYEKILGGKFRIKEINQAKYFMPVSAGEMIKVSCESKTGENGLLSIRALIEKAGAKAAMLQLLVENSKG